MTSNEPAHSDLDIDERVTVRRGANRVVEGKDAVHAVLDAGFVAHVGTVRDGAPVVIPMFYARDNDSVLLHGAPATGAIRRGDQARNDGVDVCATVTLLDGLVLARSAFHHSMNYRSVCIIGKAFEVTEPEEKAAALHRFTEVLVPGRQADLRPNSKKDIAGTSVLRLSLEHTSVKIRQGDPVDEDEDYDLPIWAGVVPMRQVFDDPYSDARVHDGVEIPTSVAELSR